VLFKKGGFGKRRATVKKEGENCMLPSMNHARGIWGRGRRKAGEKKATAYLKNMKPAPNLPGGSSLREDRTYSTTFNSRHDEGATLGGKKPNRETLSSP